jgi:site-specific recombinase XerD
LARTPPPIGVHNHVGRESLATLYLENGGSLEVLKEYLAHSFIETTMKYVHVSDARKRRDLTMVDAIFDRVTAPLIKKDTDQ